MTTTMPDLMIPEPAMPGINPSPPHDMPRATVPDGYADAMAAHVADVARSEFLALGRFRMHGRHANAAGTVRWIEGNGS